MSGPLEPLVRRAVDGDREAVSLLVGALERDVYRLALRMLGHRENAEDATQEILIRVVTRLGQFDFRSRFRTWVYRVAVNYLLDVKKSPVERLRLNFESFADDLATGLSDNGPADAERSLLTEEVKIGCTLAMLQCLDRDHRVAYVLGEILEMRADEAAVAVDVPAATFRKRLQRARERVDRFTRAHCGLVSDQAACQCNRRVTAAVALGRARPDQPQLAVAARSFDEAKVAVRAVEQVRRGLAVHRGSDPRPSDIDYARKVVSAMTAQTPADP